MSPLVGCPGPGGFLSGGAFVWGVFCPEGLFPRGSFARGHFWPGKLLAGEIFVQGCFCPGGGVFCLGGLLSGGLMPVPPKFNAYMHHVGFLCLAS